MFNREDCVLATRASKKSAKKPSVAKKGSTTKKALIIKARRKSGPNKALIITGPRGAHSAPEGPVPNSVTKRALLDAIAGRVSGCADVDEMFARAGVKVEKS